MASKLKVLVVGASIAGPTAAYWLAKAGAKVTVIERFPRLRPGGQSIDIRTAGVAVMRQMQGMEAAVRAKATTLDGMSFVRDDGRPYGIITATGNPDQQSLVSEFEIFRDDLAQILYDMTKSNENIKYVFGEQIASIQHGGNGDEPVTVEFMNHYPTTKYDLVVACDGATSRTRAIGLGCGVRDYVHPVNCWTAYFSTHKDLLQGSKTGKAYSAVGGRCIAIGPDPSGRNRVMLMGIHPRGNPDAMLPFRGALKKGNDALKEYIAQHFKGMGWKTSEALEIMKDAEDLYASEFVQVKLPTLRKGRFVLVGDAGYAPGPTGGGTTLAMAGAYVLAGEISKHEGDLEAALKSYEQNMRPIIDDLQQIPPFFPTVMAPQTAWGVWLRNHIFAFITWSRILEYAQRFLSGAFAGTDKHKLPIYEWKA